MARSMASYPAFPPVHARKQGAKPDRLLDGEGKELPRCRQHPARQASRPSCAKCLIPSCVAVFPRGFLVRNPLPRSARKPRAFMLPNGSPKWRRAPRRKPAWPTKLRPHTASWPRFKWNRPARSCGLLMAMGRCTAATSKSPPPPDPGVRPRQKRLVPRM